eukprot:g534.t1
MLATEQSSSVQIQQVKPSIESAKQSSDRFHCPYEGCNRSFAELWRLKVHYRASPDVRGSGKERGHGTELAFCPKCGAELKPGRHHVSCAANRSPSSQKPRRRTLHAKKRNEDHISMNTTLSVTSEVANESSSNVAIGLPVTWMPFDFDQFFIPIGSEASHVFVRPSRRNRRKVDCTMNLIYGTCGERPSMVTTQIGMESDLDLDFSHFFNKGVVPPLDSFKASSGVKGEEEEDSKLDFCQTSSMEYEHLEFPLESSLFDNSFDTLLSDYINHNDLGEGGRSVRQNLSDSRKRDRGPSIEQQIQPPQQQQQQQKLEKQKQKTIVSSLLSEDPMGTTNSSFASMPPMTPGMDSYFRNHSTSWPHDLKYSSVLYDNEMIPSLMENGARFHPPRLDSASSLFLNERGGREGVAANEAMGSLSLEDDTHLSFLEHSLRQAEYQSSMIYNDSLGIKPQEKKITQ